MSRGTLDTAAVTLVSLTGLSPSLAGLSRTVLLPSVIHVCSPNPDMHARRFGLFRFRSPLLPKSHVVFSSSGYLDVSVHRVPFVTLWIHVTIHEVFSCGFPHSDICGSMCICHSPQLFAAYHVFLRLLVPRHPPCALVRFTSIDIALSIGCLSCCVHNFCLFHKLSFMASDVSIFRIFAKIDIFFCSVLSFQGALCIYICKTLSSYYLVKCGSHLLSHAVSSIVPSAA